jgi:hypothetical protein
MLQTKLGDPPSISFVEIAFKGISIFSFAAPKRAQSNIYEQS